MATLNPENSFSIFLKYVLTVLESQRIPDGNVLAKRLGVDRCHCPECYAHITSSEIFSYYTILMKFPVGRRIVCNNQTIYL